MITFFFSTQCKTTRLCKGECRGQRWLWQTRLFHGCKRGGGNKGKKKQYSIADLFLESHLMKNNKHTHTHTHSLSQSCTVWKIAYDRSAIALRSATITNRPRSTSIKLFTANIDRKRSIAIPRYD